MRRMTNLNLISTIGIFYFSICLNAESNNVASDLFGHDETISIAVKIVKKGLQDPNKVSSKQLENAIERATILCGDQSIANEHFPLYIHSQKPLKSFSELPDKGINLEEHERELIYQAITKAQGNKSKAANLLGITRRKLYSMMDRLGVKELINQ